jgi:hypothetical protein
VRRKPWAVILAAFGVPYMLAVSSWAMKADRYLLPMVPVALLFAGGALVSILRSRRPSSAVQSRKSITVAIVVLVFSLPALAQYPDLWKRLVPDTRMIGREWIAAHIPSGCFIVEEAYTPELLGVPEVSLLDSEVRKKLFELKAGLPNYAVQSIPMFQVRPERSEVYYDPSLYADADIIVTSSWIGSRYEKDPGRFRVQLAFYETLENEYHKLIGFVPRGGPGPVLRLYRNPRHTVPFAGRKSLVGPSDLRDARKSAVGSAGLFFSDLGLNYEAFRFYREALTCYDIGLTYPIVRPRNFITLVLSKTRCLVRLEGREAAIVFLREISGAAPTAEGRERILQLSEQLQSGIRSTK